MRRRHEPDPLSVPPVPHYVTAAEADLWDLDGPDGSDRLWRRPIFAKLPEDFATRFARRYRRTWEREGRAAANTELREMSEGLTRHSLKLSASDQEIRDRAAACSQACDKLAARFNDPQGQYAALSGYVRSRGLEPPRLSGSEGCGDGALVVHGDTCRRSGAETRGYTLPGAVARMRCPRWWRRGLRRNLGRRIEHHAIRFGFVHWRAAKYVSDATLQRIRQQWRLNELALASVELENEEGEVLSLEDLVERSNANPYVRRSELMVRMAGTERYAESREDMGLFLTLTCPSRFHARYAQSGDENPSYDGSSPREAQSYLRRLWARIRSACQRRGLDPYGIRVAEPHHDGAPHWHLLVFIPKAQKAAFVNLCREQALKDSPDEPGAQEKRFTAKNIDRSKGTATGYIAKYISKNIDGHGMEADEDGDEITSSAERVRAWASVWGIRQFQFFGGPPVTVWRELRRLPTEVYGSDVIERARQAADAGDWQSYMAIMGGAGCKRDVLPIRMATQWSDRESAYGEPMGELVYGVRCGQVTVETRFHVWTATRKVEVAETQCQVRAGVNIYVYGGDVRIRIEAGGETDQSRAEAVYVTGPEDFSDAYTWTYTDRQCDEDLNAPGGRGVG